MNDQRQGFGIALKALRETRRVSQSKLAERAGFDHSYVSRLESGARTPTREAVLQLAGAMTLAHGEQDALLAAAGFLPREVASLLSAEPEITQVLSLLQDEGLPVAYRDKIRESLRTLVDSWRLAQIPVASVTISSVAA